MKKIIIIILVLLVLGLVAYSFVVKNKSNTVLETPLSNTETSTTSEPVVPVSNTSTKTTPVPSNVTVHIKDFAFNPQTLKIKAGTSVTWVNDDPMAHTITSDSDNILNSPTLSPGQSFSFTFTNPGSTNYHCNIHKSMKGVVIVE